MTFGQAGERGRPFLEKAITRIRQQRREDWQRRRNFARRG
jgi:hypothetical protein